MTPLMSYSAGRRMLAGLIVGVAATVPAPRRLYDPETGVRDVLRAQRSEVLR
jgi:hypothetical protein